MRRLKNVTMTVEPEVADLAAEEARRRGMSMSRWLGEIVRRSLGDPEGARDPGAGQPLPEFLRPLFWEFEFDALRWPTARDLVIAKVFEGGDPEALAWVRSALGNDFLRTWLIARRGRGLDPRQITFWAAVLALPEELTRRWIRAQADDPWAQRLRS